MSQMLLLFVFFPYSLLGSFEVVLLELFFDERVVRSFSDSIFLLLLPILFLVDCLFVDFWKLLLSTLLRGE